MVGVLQRERRGTGPGGEPPPIWARRDLKSRLVTYGRRALSILLVLAATITGGYLALVGYHQTRELSASTRRRIKQEVSRTHGDIAEAIIDGDGELARHRMRRHLQAVTATLS